MIKYLLVLLFPVLCFGQQAQQLTDMDSVRIDGMNAEAYWDDKFMKYPVTDTIIVLVQKKYAPIVALNDSIIADIATDVRDPEEAIIITYEGTEIDRGRRRPRKVKQRWKAKPGGGFTRTQFNPAGIEVPIPDFLGTLDEFIADKRALKDKEREKKKKDKDKIKTKGK